MLNGLTVTAIAGGGDHSLALANGQVYAWGFNNFGQLGNNSTTDSSIPVAVTTTGTPLNLLAVTAIAAGNAHNLALASGQVYAWGFNGDGQLGNNSTTDSSIPVAVTTAGTPLSGLTVTAIAAGNSHSLALASGHVYAWGENTNSQLGNNSMTNSSIPVAVSTAGVLNGLTVTAIAAGGFHSVALANGKVFAWGYNAQGQLGNNSTTNSSVPVAVSSSVLNSLTVTQIAAGFQSSYALTSTGRLFAWGDNTYGELGIGSSTTSFTTPQEVLPPSGYIWSSIALDPTGYHVVATVIATPEPGSLLLAAGLGLLAVRLRRRGKRVEIA